MFNLLITIGAVVIIFGVCTGLMAVGLMLRGTVMRGGCGSHGSAGGCEVCSKKMVNLCDSEDDSGLAGPSFVATMGRYQKKSNGGKNAV